MIMIAGFYTFYGVALMLRMRTEVLRRHRHQRWVKDLIEKG
jgi:heme exporter protein C